MYWSASYTWGCPTRAMYVDHGTGPKRLVHGERPQKETAGNKGTILRVNARQNNHLRKFGKIWVYHGVSLYHQSEWIVKIRKDSFVGSTH